MHAVRHHSFGPAAGVHLLDTFVRAGRTVATATRVELPMVPGREVADAPDRAVVDGSRAPHVGSVFELARAAAAHRALETRSSVGKVVLMVDR